jgi:hypothetical protein
MEEGEGGTIRNATISASVVPVATFPGPLGRFPFGWFPSLIHGISKTAMSMLRRAVASLVLLSAAASAAVAAPRLLADLTGKWAVTVATPDGTQPSVMTLTQKADSITGTLESQLGSAPVAGVVKGDSVKFAFQLDMGGQQLVINGAGAMKDKDNMNGVLDVAGLGVMPFTAIRQP